MGSIWYAKVPTRNQAILTIDVNIIYKLIALIIKVCKHLFARRFFRQCAGIYVKVLWVGVGSDNGLVPNRQQAIIWSNADPVRWCIYAALGEMS